MPKIRRPLIALIVLVAALVIGYLINALSDDNSSPKSDAWHYEISSSQQSDWDHAVRLA